MSYQSPDRNFMDALKTAAARVEQLNFEAVAPAIGLGALKPRQKMRPESRGESGFTKKFVPMPAAIRREPEPAPPKPQARMVASKRHFRLIRALCAHCLDLSVICLTLLVCAKTIACIFMPPERLSFAYFFDAFDPTVYLEFGGINLLLVLYTAFALYWVFFKIFAGNTLGGSLFLMSSPP